MQLIEEKKGSALWVKAKGRLDASWSNSFAEQMLNHVRQGEHHMVLDASELSYLSSAGIRSLLLLYKALMAVQGTFSVVRAEGMVETTLRDSGFEQWLNKGDSEPAASEETHTAMDATLQGDHYVLDAAGELTIDVVDAWNPWHPVNEAACREIVFRENLFGLGIGCAGSDYACAREHLGEFVAVSGHVVLQPPDERSRPDFLIAERQFVPTLQCIQSLRCEGPMSHQFRFAPTEDVSIYPITGLIEKMRNLTSSAAVGFVVAGEVEGLVGASLIRSPGLLAKDEGSFPAVREWLSFCGERVYAREQCIITGVVSGEKIHTHAAVFPYQPLPNGCLDLRETVGRFFNASPPRAVMHLVKDDRPGIGLGESALLRGVCWCARIGNVEVLP